jgi:hypothetical protein
MRFIFLLLPLTLKERSDARYRTYSAAAHHAARAGAARQPVHYNRHAMEVTAILACGETRRCRHRNSNADSVPTAIQ